MNYYLINVPGSYGYTIPVKSQNISPDHFNFDNEVIDAAVKKGLFYDNKESYNANVVEMTPYDLEHFSKPGINIHDID